MPKRPLESWWQELFPGTPPQVPRRQYGSRMRGDFRGSEPPLSGRGYVRPFDSPIASPRPQAYRGIPQRGRWVSFGRHYRTFEGPGHPAEWWTPPAPRYQQRRWLPDQSSGIEPFEIETPIAVGESTGLAFSTAFIEFAATGFLMWAYTKVVPKGKDPANWNDRIIDWIERNIYHRHKKAPPVPHTVISGTPQPKATCHPGFRNSFTAGLGTPIALSA